MKNRKQKLQENLTRLKALSQEINAMIEDGSFYALSFFERYVYIRQIKSLYNRLLGPVAEVNLQKILAAAAVVVLGTSFGAGCDEEKEDSNSTNLILLSLLNRGPSFAYVTENPFGLTDAGSGAKPFFVDIDRDGDLDVMVGVSDGNDLFFRNSGDASNPAFSFVATNPFGLVDYGNNASPAFVDIDNDLDPDAIIGTNGNTYYMKYTGITEPWFSYVGANQLGLTNVGSNLSPAFADLDDDGDQDLVIGNYYGNIYYFSNTGDSSTPAFTQVSSNPFGITNVGFYAAPVFVDIDGDGDYDLFVGSSYGTVAFFENTGGPLTPAFIAAVTDSPFGLTDVGSNAAPTFADIDADGDLDAFIGNAAGNIFYFENKQK